MSWLRDRLEAAIAYCDRCGQETLDQAERLPHESLYCGDCVEIIFG